MRKILSKHIYDVEPPAFGLDISDFVLKIALLKPQGDNFTLASFIETPIPEGVVINSEIQKLDELLKIFQESVKNIKGDKIKTKFVAATIPERKSFLRIIQLPQMPDADIEKAIKFEIEANIPLSLDEAYFDWQILGESNIKIDHRDILVAVAPKFVIDPYAELIKRAGFTPKVLELESIAISRSVIPGLKTEKPTLIVNLGATQVSFIIFSNEAPRFSTSINTPNRNHMTHRISEHMKITMEEAEKIKRSVGLDKTKYEGRVFEALEPAIKTLIGQIEEYADYYISHAQHEHTEQPKISKIILCGGDANLTGIAPYLSGVIKIPVELGNPWVNILPAPLKEIPLMPYEKSLAFTSGLGIALRGATQ